MAVRFDADAEDYTRVLSLGSQSTLTVACWFKISTDRNTWSTIFSIDSGQVDNWLMQTAEDGVTMNAVMDASTREGMGALTVGTWYFACLATSGTTGNLYYKADGATTLTTQAITGASAVTADTLRLGESPWGGEWLNGCLTAVKVWNAQLTAAEAHQESFQHLPHRTANLLAWYPLIQPDTKDYSGNGRTLSGGASTATEDGPKIGWRRGPSRFTLTSSGTTVTGTAAGVFGFTGTAVGVDRALGSGTGSFGFAAAAQGVDRALGAATGSFGFTATASGTTSTPPVTGVGTGAFGFTATAAGVPETFGQAVAVFGFTGAAAGVDRAVGAAATALGFTATALGTDRALGAATATFGFSATASGVPDVHGAASGVFGFAGSASGFAGTPPVTGTAIAAFGFTATAQGQPRTAGAATALFGVTATATAKVTVVAVAVGGFGFSSTAAGLRETHGTAVALLGFTAVARGMPIGPIVPGAAHAATGTTATSTAVAGTAATASPASMTVPTATGG